LRAVIGFAGSAQRPALRLDPFVEHVEDRSVRLGPAQVAHGTWRPQESARLHRDEMLGTTGGQRE